MKFPKDRNVHEFSICDNDNDDISYVNLYDNHVETKLQLGPFETKQMKIGNPNPHKNPNFDINEDGSVTIKTTGKYMITFNAMLKSSASIDANIYISSNRQISLAKWYASIPTSVPISCNINYISPLIEEQKIYPVIRSSSSLPSEISITNCRLVLYKLPSSSTISEYDYNKIKSEILCELMNSISTKDVDLLKTLIPGPPGPSGLPEPPGLTVTHTINEPTTNTLKFPKLPTPCKYPDIGILAVPYTPTFDSETSNYIESCNYVTNVDEWMESKFTVKESLFEKCLYDGKITNTDENIQLSPVPIKMVKLCSPVTPKYTNMFPIKVCKQHPCTDSSEELCMEYVD